MQLWNEYVELLKTAPDMIGTPSAPVDEQLTADLHRQFAMNLSQGYFLLVQADPDYPEWLPFENSVFLAQPNPDAVYYYARVDGGGTYRVTGERGTAIVAGFATGARILGTSDTPGKGFGNYDIDRLTLDADGRFDVIFSAQRPEGLAGDWLHLDPEADFILVRQFNYDWGRETDMRLAIERLDAMPTKPRLSPVETDRRLRELFAYAGRLSRVAVGAIRRPHDQGFVNRVHLHDFKDLGNGDDWPQAYFETIFELADDEALVLETELPEQRHYWNVQVVDGLWNQAEILYRQTSLNGATARIDSDGWFRAVLSRRDPGIANWLDTGDHSYGMLIGRWYRCSSHPTPGVTRMKLAEVDAYLGDRPPRIAPGKREAALRERLIGSQLRRRW